MGDIMMSPLSQCAFSFGSKAAGVGLYSHLARQVSGSPGFGSAPGAHSGGFGKHLPVASDAPP